MKKENIKTDDSIKTRLKIESGNNSAATSAGSENSVNDEGNTEDNDTTISQEEIKLLNESGGESTEEDSLKGAQLDNKDTDGVLLNVSSSADDKTGRDLDVPGADDDDEMEDIGEEDEENNPYSLSDNND